MTLSSLPGRVARLLRRAGPSVALALVAVVATSGQSRADDSMPSPLPEPVPAPRPVTDPVLPAPQDPLEPQEPQNPQEPNGKTGAPVRSAGQRFATPELAAKAFCDAIERNDDAALKRLAGPGNEDLVLDGTDPSVRQERAALSAAIGAKLELEPQADGRVVLVVGTAGYPLPVPLVQGTGGWCLDASAGRKELLARRIGESELEAVGICLAYADAQLAYASKDRDGDGVKSYAQRLTSTPGAFDGLHWETTEDEGVSPAGPGLLPPGGDTDELVATAPFAGYRWRILTSQGPSAPGEAYSYVINGRMIAGFALVAIPASYRITGVMSFMVSNHGKVYEKDLGADTATIGAAIESFDPDVSWREVDDATLRAAAVTSPEDTAFDEDGAIRESSSTDTGGRDQDPSDESSTTGSEDRDGDVSPNGEPSSPTPPCDPPPLR